VGASRIARRLAAQRRLAGSLTRANPRPQAVARSEGFFCRRHLRARCQPRDIPTLLLCDPKIAINDCRLGMRQHVLGVDRNIVRARNLCGNRAHRRDLHRRKRIVAEVARRRIPHTHDREPRGEAVTPGSVRRVGSGLGRVQVAHVGGQIVRRLDDGRARTQRDAEMVTRVDRRVISAGPVQVDAFDAPARKGEIHARSLRSAFARSAL